jgi:DNA-binding MarR family transcriptional regulator
MTSTAPSVRDRVGYLVKQLQHVLRARMDDELGAIGLSTAQYALLAAIEEAPGSSGAELARRCFITPQSVNGLIGALERAHLIERSASPSHGRIIEIALTASGKSRLRSAHRAVAAIEQTMLRRLDEQERQHLACTLRHCIEDLIG